MSLDLTVHGDPANVRRLADSLDNMNRSVCELAARMSEWSTSPSRGWNGNAANEFQYAVSHVQRSQASVNDYLIEAVVVLRAYANRLEWGQEYFDEILDSAHNVGLKVIGRWLLEPQPSASLDHCPVPTTARPGMFHTNGSSANLRGRDLSPEMQAWNEYVRLVSAYNEASMKVGAWEGELGEWLMDHMAPLVQNAVILETTANNYLALRDHAEFAIDAALEAFESRVEIGTNPLRAEQSKLSDAASKSLHVARAGNHARLDAYEAFDVAGVHEKLSGLEARLGAAAHYSKIFGAAGLVADASFALYDVSNGASETLTLAGLVGGVIGGLATAAVVGSGPILPGAVMVAGGVGLGAASARLLVDATVDLETREAIDHWIEEHAFWDSTSGTLVSGQVLGVDQFGDSSGSGQIHGAGRPTYQELPWKSP